MKKIVVGITGGVASGKTTVLEIFKSEGYSAVSTDDISRDLFFSGSTSKKIERFFKTTDRKKIADIVFLDKQKRTMLEKILHPPIISGLKYLIKQNPNDLIAVEVPLLFEKNLKKLFNIVVVVWSKKTNQLERLEKVGFKKETALKMISSQMPLGVKKKLADKVIINSGGIALLKSKAKKLARLLKKGID